MSKLRPRGFGLFERERDMNTIIRNPYGRERTQAPGFGIGTSGMNVFRIVFDRRLRLFVDLERERVE